jgi:hypothetical protein
LEARADLDEVLEDLLEVHDRFPETELDRGFEDLQHGVEVLAVDAVLDAELFEFVEDPREEVHHALDVTVLGFHGMFRLRALDIDGLGESLPFVHASDLTNHRVVVAVDVRVMDQLEKGLSDAHT